MARVVRLFDLPHAEARRLLAESAAPVHLGVNPVEYHGPHLSLHNDRLVSQGLAADLHDALFGEREPFVVACDLELGAEPASGPGSRHASSAALREAITEAVRSLYELGARRLVVHTFHGGTLHNHAIHEGVQLMERLGGRALAPFAHVLRAMVRFDVSLFDDALAALTCPEAERRDVRERLRFDFHAGWLETSLALHYAPESVSDVRLGLPPGPSLGEDAALARAATLAKRLGRDGLAAELEFLATASTWTRVRPFPGYTSRPDLASAEAGARIGRLFVARYAEATRAVLAGAERSPAPPFAFMRALTLDGRLDPTAVPQAEVLRF
jgi:creatinine amidohydrolase